MTDDFLDDLLGDALVPDKVFSAPAVSEKAKVMAGLKDIEDGIYGKALDIVETANLAAEVDPAQDKPPADWIERYGPEEAARRYRVARAAWASAKDAPVFLAMAQKTVQGVQRNRTEDNRSRALAAVVEFHVDPMPAYPIRKVEK